MGKTIGPPVSKRVPAVRRPGDNHTEEAFMKYLMMVCVEHDPVEATGEPGEDVEPWVEEMDRRRVRVMGERLHGTADWTTVRVREGEVVISDGPYTETKEFIGGFDVLDCADLDEAIEIASKHPVAKFGALELRPFWPL
jgi:hypothetical protein